LRLRRSPHGRPVGECGYCRKVLDPAAAYIRAQLHHQKVFGGGTDCLRRFHPACFAAFGRQGGRLPDSDLVREIVQADLVPAHPGSSGFPNALKPERGRGEQGQVGPWAEVRTSAPLRRR
jgi:hypothetical protein